MEAGPRSSFFDDITRTAHNEWQSANGQTSQSWTAQEKIDSLFSSVAFGIRNVKNTGKPMKSDMVEEVYKTWKYVIEVNADINHTCRESAYSAILTIATETEDGGLSPPLEDNFRFQSGPHESLGSRMETMLKNPPHKSSQSIVCGKFEPIMLYRTSTQLEKKYPVKFRFVVQLFVDGILREKHISGPFTVHARAKEHCYNTKKAMNEEKIASLEESEILHVDSAVERCRGIIEQLVTDEEKKEVVFQLSRRFSECEVATNTHLSQVRVPPPHSTFSTDSGIPPPQVLSYPPQFTQPSFALEPKDEPVARQESQSTSTSSGFHIGDSHEMERSTVFGIERDYESSSFMDMVRGFDHKQEKPT